MELLPDHLKGQSLYDRSYQKRTDVLTAAAADPKWAETWQELGQGAPTLAGLARICSTALATGGAPDMTLSPEAKALLFAAKDRGTLEVKGSNRAFDAPGRMLAVYVEAAADRTLIFRSRENPAFTIRFLAGFRELCQANLVMHHIYHEFSLTREGLDLAQTISLAEVQNLLAMATDLGVFE
jgi:hypothetical protein